MAKSFFMAKERQITPDYIFESSWEVCNKVGGIYTVLSTRANTLRGLVNDNLIFIGPDIWQNTDNPDFIEDKTLLKEWKKQAVKDKNLQVRIGRWNIPGAPIAILVDFLPYYKEKDLFYYRMWEKFGVSSAAAYGDYDEASMFAYAAGLVIESLYRYLKLEDKNVIAHLNEWMLGLTALFLQDRVPAIATVFTTHATSIGRSICGNNKPLYDQFENYNGDQMARELNMEAKHSLEKQTAVYADCFTTVSRLTAAECKQLLDKEPDVITPNGFEFDFVPKGKTFEKKRTIARQALIRTASRLIGENISEDALLLAISGRYEYKNKGIDIFIEAVNRVRLANPERQIVAYILVPAWIDGARIDLLNRLQNNEISKYPLYHPYYTHNLNFPEHDKVCRYLQHLNFLNQPEYKTKLIFVPSYLNEKDGIFNLSYYDLLVGLDLTVFPSYYEPWGYTPLESIAFGIPTITTNLAGFGLWAKEQGATGECFKVGVEVVERTDHNYFEIAEQIKDNILEYAKQSPEQVQKTKDAARTLSKKASWSHFIDYYTEAYETAFNKANKRIKKEIV
jgi:hypothetical protein